MEYSAAICEKPKKCFFHRRRPIPRSIIQSAINTIIQNIAAYTSMQGAATYAGTFTVGVAGPFDHLVFKHCLEDFRIKYLDYNKLTGEENYIIDPNYHYYFLKIVATTAFLALVVTNPSLLNHFSPEGVFDVTLECVPRWIFRLILHIKINQNSVMEFEYFKYEHIAL